MHIHTTDVYSKPVTPTTAQSLLDGLNRFAGIVLSLLLLASCLEEQGIDELRRFQAESLANMKAEIDPLPVVLPPQRFNYSADKERDPFSLQNVIEPKEEATIVQEPSPDENRPREPLEAFPLDQLKMVGTMVKRGQNWALIRSPDQVVHRVTLGQHLGQNSGKVMSISESQILLAETTRAPNGKWVKSKANLHLEE